MLFAIVCVSAKSHVNFVVGKIFAYTSPFVILNALLLLLIFVNIDKKGFPFIIVDVDHHYFHGGSLNRSNPNLMLE